MKEFRPCFSRHQSFLWFVVCTMAFSVRNDLAGVTSFVRCLGLDEVYYDRILDFFHSKVVKLDALAKAWTNYVVNSGLGYKVNGRLIILGDGIKAAKEGRKMPGVKSLHQESESNSKPEFIMGHSFQAFSFLTCFFGYFFATPIIARIHEGVVISNRNQKTLLDKMIVMLKSLDCSQPYYLVCDAYYASGKIILPLLKIGQNLITRVRVNAVAYLPLNLEKKKRGRPKLYGAKLKLKNILSDTKKMTQVTSNLYDDAETKFLFRSMDLLWRPVGRCVRFVFVVHPTSVLAQNANHPKSLK